MAVKTGIEQFEALGFKSAEELREGEELSFSRLNEDTTITMVSFLSEEKMYEVMTLLPGRFFKKVYKPIITCVDMPLQKAINKQLRELGWLK